MKAVRSLTSVAMLLACSTLVSARQGDWPTYGQDQGGQRYAALTQITPTNVSRLEVAWTYHMRPEGAPHPKAGDDPIRMVSEGTAPQTPFSASQVTPLVVGGRMFITTPYNRVVALDPATGKELWVYQVPEGRPSTRGLEYWPGDTKAPARIFFGTREGLVYALDAATGKLAAGFGNGGVLQLRTPDIMQGSLPEKALGITYYGLTSPPIVFDNLLITGSSVQELPVLGASGDVRAWDVHTGKLVWRFHSIPRKGEPGHDSWPEGSTEGRSGVNVWGFMSVDARRGIVYMPFGAPAIDRWGGDREGDNLFSSSIVAADAKTGKYLWHFQVVHHDIWDYDTQSAPLLFDARVDGKTIPAVAITNKSGLVFVLDRTNGKPIFPIEERPVPQSDVPGEKTSPTQPFPMVTEPLSRTFVDVDKDIANVTPELEAWCRNYVKTQNVKSSGLYWPPSTEESRLFIPSTEGGVDWGGMAYDPKRNLLFVNSNDRASIIRFQKNDGFPPYMARGPGNGQFAMLRTKMPCLPTPWGHMNAIDMATGKIAWRSVLGVTDSLPAEKAKTGRPSMGGPIATEGGVVFIGATDDDRFRAFDSRTGAELWSVKLAASAHAVPISYLAGGRQMVAIAATGGGFLATPIVSDEIVAFALPK